MGASIIIIFHLFNKDALNWSKVKRLLFYYYCDIFITNMHISHNQMNNMQ